jgi:hypothetical protein
MAYLSASKIGQIVAGLKASLWKSSMTTLLTEVNNAIVADATGVANMPAAAGTAEANKLAWLGATRNLDVINSATSAITNLTVTNLTIGATLVTATGAELNIMDGVTATKDELNNLDGPTAGVASASKAAVLGANKNLDEFHTAALYLGPGAGTLVTASAAELNALPVNKGLRAVGVLRVASAVEDAQTVTIGADIYEVDTCSAGAHVGAGNIRLNLTGGSTVRSRGTLTVDTQPTAGDTMTIGTKVYTFVPNGTANADGEVGVGTSLATAKTNIVAAVNGSDGHNVAHTLVTMAAFVVNNAVVTAIWGGTDGDAIATTETFAAGTNVFDAATLGTTTAGVDPTAGEMTTAFAAAVNASGTEPISAYRVGANEVLLYADSVGVLTTALAETLLGANNLVDSAAMRAGAAAATLKMAYAARVPNATEIALDHMAVVLDFAPTVVWVQVRVTATGALKAWDGGAAIATAPNRIVIDNGGGTDWDANDTVYVVAYGS